MAAGKQRADQQKQKEKKEKIILAALVGVLVVVGAIELPAMLKKSSPSASPATTGTTGMTTGALTDTSSSAGGTASSDGTQASGAGGATTLPNLPGYQAGAQQLSRFSFFSSHDPFGTEPGGETGASGTTTSSTTTTSTGAYTAALISVNGTAQVVSLNASFPSTSPTFTLLSISASSVKIGVAGGSFSGGTSTLTLRKGHTVVLENTADGTRYKLKLISSLKAGSAIPQIPQIVTTDTGIQTSQTTDTTTDTTTTTP